MASFLYRIGRASYRRWYIVLASWIALLAVVGGLAAAFSAPASSSFTIPGIPSERAQTLLTERFPSDTGEDPQTAPTFNMVIATEDGSPLTSPENQEKVTSLLDEIRAIPGLDAPEAVGTLGLPEEALAAGSPDDQPWLTAVQAQSQGLIDQTVAAGGDPAQAETDAAMVSPLSADESVYKVSAGFDTETTPSAVDMTDEQRQSLTDVTAAGDELGLEVAYNGPAAQDMGAIGFTSEIIGIVVALIVLAITFGSIAAAGLPIVTAIVGVGIAVLSVHSLSGVVDVNDIRRSWPPCSAWPWRSTTPCSSPVATSTRSDSPTTGRTPQVGPWVPQALRWCSPDSPCSSRSSHSRSWVSRSCP